MDTRVPADNKQPQHPQPQSRLPALPREWPPRANPRSEQGTDCKGSRGLLLVLSRDLSCIRQNPSSSPSVCPRQVLHCHGTFSTKSKTRSERWNWNSLTLVTSSGDRLQSHHHPRDKPDTQTSTTAGPDGLGRTQVFSGREQGFAKPLRFLLLRC